MLFILHYWKNQIVRLLNVCHTLGAQNIDLSVVENDRSTRIIDDVFILCAGSSGDDLFIVVMICCSCCQIAAKIRTAAAGFCEVVSEGSRFSIESQFAIDFARVLEMELNVEFVLNALKER